jgi:G:T-mismatch repair DNA endonuclease (very short patch repair protein)
VSKVEHKWATFMIFENPSAEYMSSFTSIKGQKYFKECIPDLYSPVLKEALFFHGCYYHGHYENCLKNKNATEKSLHISGLTYSEINKCFIEKAEALLTNHIEEVETVTVFWECNFRVFTEKTKKYEHFLKHVFQPHPLKRLNPRDAVRGAFSEVYKLKWENRGDMENFYFVDVNGLYSACAKDFKYMTGKYEIVIGENLSKLKISCNETSYNGQEVTGVVYLRILPPKNLAIPFLQYRSKHNKVYLTLCSSCAEFENKKLCKHSEIERALVGTYYFSEIQFALKLKYQILQIFESYCYFEAKPILKTFVTLLDNLKLKNSDLLHGLPSDQKATVCTKINDVMKFQSSDLQLTPTNVTFNKHKKYLYKLMANSFFGKFQQKRDKTKTIFVTSQEQLEDIYYSEDQIADIFCCNEDLCQIQLRQNSSKLIPSRIYNCLIGGQITAYARQTIYEHLLTIQNAGGAIYYVDCDCILFTLPKQIICPLPISQATGHFKHEYKNIQSFYAFAIKNYALSYYDANNKLKTVTKVKGLNLQTATNKNELSVELFSKMFENLLFQQEKSILQVRKRKKCQLLCFKFSNLTTTKRVIDLKDKNYSTSPYGFQFE